MNKSVVNEEPVPVLVNSCSTCCSKFQMNFTGGRLRNSHF